MNLYYLVSLFLVPYLILIGKHYLHVLQQNFYNENNRYLKWGISKWKTVLSIGTLLLCFMNFCNVFFKKTIFLLVNVFYLFLFWKQYCVSKREQVKIPLKVTSRLKRLVVTLVILYLVPFGLSFFFFDIYWYYFILTLFLFAEFFLVYFANVINIPIEKYVFNFYKRKAMKKLQAMNQMDVVGITGSYGKTSSKNILNDILSVRFNSFPTPKNYNTQYGLILTINNYLDKFEDVFIAEMGAFKKGRIKLLCDLVKPKYGILTRIGTAHLETFGSQENIQEGKFELIESLPSDGVGILNRDDPYQVSYSLKNDCSILWIGIHNQDADYVARNIRMNENGMFFDVFFQTENETIPFETSLLGEANIYNILAGLALGRYLGMSYEELQIGVKKIRPISHRLELIHHGATTIIDDAYNSNPVGSKMALDVLNLMKGFRVVVTPGMIELGEKQYEYNKKFGEYISEVADLVILVGKEQTKPILDGLLAKDYNRDKIKIVNDVKKAFPIIEEWKKKDIQTYILLENDLPDIFNEK